MSTTDELQRLFTSYGNAMYRNDPDAAEKIAAKFSAALAQQPAASGEPATLQLWCDTCEGTGKVHQEHQRGVIGSGGTFDCPDCDGNGFVKTSRYVLAATAQPAPALVPLTDQQLCSMRKENLADDDSPAWAYEKGVRDAENAHGVTQGEPK